MGDMAGDKNSYTLDLNPDHMDFLTATKDKYRIPDESKVVRIALDYLFLNEDIHDTVFAEPRCRRCGG